MNRRVIWILLVCLLCACAAPAQTAEHPDWDEDWFRFGDVLAIEPIDGFTLGESNDVLSISGLWYATFTAGEGEAIVNAQGRDATVYDAQIYVLVKEGRAEQGAQADIADWMQRERTSYDAVESQIDVGGRTYRVLTLTGASENNPYHHGTAAFLVYGANALTVEVLAKEDFPGDTGAILTDFLSRLHF